MELPAPGGNGPGRLASAHRDACRARRSAREDGESSARTRRWAGTDGPDAERWPRIGGPSSSPTGWPLTEPARTGRRRRTAAIDTADSHTGRAPAHPDLSGEKHGHQRGTQRRRRRTGAHAARPAKEQDRLVEAGTARAAGPQTHPDPPAKAQPAIEAAHDDSGRATNPPGPAGEGTAGHRGRARRQRPGHKPTRTRRRRHSRPSRPRTATAAGPRLGGGEDGGWPWSSGVRAVGEAGRLGTESHAGGACRDGTLRGSWHGGGGSQGPAAGPAAAVSRAAGDDGAAESWRAGVVRAGQEDVRI